jgi:thiosulfate dehydrogenase [quinone] large subunit
MATLRSYEDHRGRVQIPGPPIANALFKHAQASLLWLLVRLWVGWQWLEAGWGKLNNPVWTDGSGRAIGGFWQKAVGTNPEGQQTIAFDWYRAFIQVLIDNQAQGWFSTLIVVAELATGVMLILGALVGLAAAVGLTMNLAYMLAGSASINPVLMLLEVLLIAAWKVAGYFGLDRYLLPALGTPWWRPNEQRDENAVRSLSATGDRANWHE